MSQYEDNSVDPRASQLPVFTFSPPTRTWDKDEESPNYYDWREVYPYLGPLRDLREAIAKEAVSVSSWTSWPEHSLYKKEVGEEWNVVPFCYTFPGNDPSKTTWVEQMCERCPFTASVLKSIPGVRTALFSKFGPSVSLCPHQGWAHLSNHVLRCHLGLIVPRGNLCGMNVEEEIQFHKEGEIIVFDDSKIHSAFNNSTSERIVLIIDLARPMEVPEGDATQGETAELEDFIQHFH